MYQSMKLVSSYKIVLDHPANSREDGVALFINSLSKPAATQQLTSVSSSKAKSWGERKKKKKLKVRLDGDLSVYLLAPIHECVSF